MQIIQNKSKTKNVKVTGGEKVNPNKARIDKRNVDLDKCKSISDVKGFIKKWL